MGSNEKGLELGDIVDVRGVVVNSGDVVDKVRVRLFSPYHGAMEYWYANNDVTLVTKAADADEPPVDALVEVTRTCGRKPLYFRRIVAPRPTDECRWLQLNYDANDMYAGTSSTSRLAWWAVKELGTVNRLYRESEV